MWGLEGPPYINISVSRAACLPKDRPPFLWAYFAYIIHMTKFGWAMLACIVAIVLAVVFLCGREYLNIQFQCLHKIP